MNCWTLVKLQQEDKTLTKFHELIDTQNGEGEDSDMVQFIQKNSILFRKTMNSWGQEVTRWCRQDFATKCYKWHMMVQWVDISDFQEQAKELLEIYGCQGRRGRRTILWILWHLPTYSMEGTHRSSSTWVNANKRDIFLSGSQLISLDQFFPHRKMDIGTS